MAAHIAKITDPEILKKIEDACLTHNCQPWDFLPGLDTYSSFPCFILYRDMGDKRAIGGVAKQMGRETASYLSTLAQWVRRGLWQARAMLYDNYLAQRKREESEKIEIKDHVKKLRRYRRELENLGWENLSIAQQTINIGRKYLNHVEANPEIIEKMRSSDFKNIMTAGSACGHQGLEALSEALAVAQLLEQIPIDDESEDEEGIIDIVATSATDEIEE